MKKEKIGLGVPDGYFDRLEQDVLSKTSRAPRPKRLQLRPYMSWAAVFIFAVAAWFLWKQEAERPVFDSNQMAMLNEAFSDEMEAQIEILNELGELLNEIDEYEESLTLN